MAGRSKGFALPEPLSSRLSRFLRLIVPTAMLALLSACWMSATPLVDASNSQAIEFTGSWEGKEDGKKVTLEIVDNGDGSYTTGNGKEKYHTLFLPLGEGWYLYQVEVQDDGESFFMYYPMQFADGKIMTYETDCDESLGEIEGMEVSDYSCSFAHLDALTQATRNLIAGLESGEIEKEPQVYEMSGKKAVEEAAEEEPEPAAEDAVDTAAEGDSVEETADDAVDTVVEEVVDAAETALDEAAVSEEAPAE